MSREDGVRAKGERKNMINISIGDDGMNKVIGGGGDAGVMLYSLFYAIAHCIKWKGKKKKKTRKCYARQLTG